MIENEQHWIGARALWGPQWTPVVLQVELLPCGFTVQPKNLLLSFINSLWEHQKSRAVAVIVKDGDIRWIFGWYSSRVNILNMSIHEKQKGAFVFCSRLPLRYRLSFWCWWIKAPTGNRIRRKDSQGLPCIVEQLSTPLIHLIRFSQLSFLLFFSPPFHEYTGLKFATACPSWHSEAGASPSISAKKGGKKIKPSQNTYCWSALI